MNPIRIALIALPILAHRRRKATLVASSHGAHIMGPALIAVLVGVSLVARLALRVAR
jgi:hypothetical protein